jgi:type IV secretion system protein VirB1
MTLATLVQLCAPAVAPNTALAIISVESGGAPWAIDDDTTKKSYHPKNYSDAVAQAHELLDRGDNLDVGLMQVNSSNFATYGVDVDTAFDPCTNVTLGATILMRSYNAAVQIYGPGEKALWHAFEIYNSGHANGSPDYAKYVWHAGLSSHE